MKPRVKFIKRSKFISQEAINIALRPLQISIISLIIVRQYSPDLWGSFVGFLVGVEILITLLNWGQKPFLVREFSMAPKKINAKWYMAFFARFFLLLIVFAGVFIVPQLSEYVLPFSLWVATKWIASMYDSLVQFHRNYWRSILSEFIALALALIAMILIRDFITLFQLMVVFAMSGLGKLLVLIPLTPSFKREYIDFRQVRKEYILAMPFLALTVAGLIQAKSDLYVVTYYLEKTDVALYQVIIGFLVLGQSFSAIILGPFQKNIYRTIGDSYSKLKKTYVLIGLISSAIFSIVLYILLRFLYGFEVRLELVLLFLVYLLPLYFYLIESQVLLKYKKEKDLLRFTILSGASNLVLSLLLVPFFGIIGALIAGIVCRVFLAFMVVNRSIKIRVLNAH